MAKTKKADRSGQFWLIPNDAVAQHQRVAAVAAPGSPSQLLIASIPESLSGAIQVGSVVRITPKSGKPVDGLCIEISEAKWDQTRPQIASVLLTETLLNASLVRLGQWIGEYYVSPPGRVFAAMLPARLRTPRMIRVRWLRAIGDAGEKATARQAAVLAALTSGPRRAREVISETGATTAILQTLHRRGAIEIFEEQEAAPPSANRMLDAEMDTTFQPHCPEDDFALTVDQTTALEKILATLHVEPSAFGVYVLFGIPGSGKTEVYVRAIRETIAQGRQAILLVPEIALATQVVARLARRFERVAILHSRLTPRARTETLRVIASGAADVVIGTRTAVFAPCPRLGLIIVDEEQETSFKNQAAPRFHARDVAIMRAQQAAIPVVLGSATPSLETWHNASTLPHYHLLTLRERVPGAKLPQVMVVSREERDSSADSWLLHERLVTLLRQTLAAGQQAVILHNRRGYARALQCERCGLTPTCDRCRAPLVFHEIASQMRCHRCGFATPAPSKCPNETCGGRMQRIGIGIQRVHEEISRVTPGARILRVDSDTLKHRRDYVEALRRVEAHEVDVLLGTQIVAKGLDFPAVNLVGVIDADATLWLPDFRSAERTFQLLMQVIGRAGRRDGESVALLQAADPNTPAVRFATGLDFAAFAAHELLSREHWGFPPFTRLARIILADDRPHQAEKAAAQLAADLSHIAPRVSAALHISEAEVCPVARHRDRLRYHVMIRAARDGSLQQLLHRAAIERKLRRAVQRQIIDVDAVDLL